MVSNKDNEVLIFLVDDDDFQLKLLQNRFKTATKFQLHTCKSGEEFLETLIKTKFSKKTIIIVILDYYLRTEASKETKNGLEILKMIREINPDINVIMYSVSDDAEVATSAMHYGAYNFIKKNENSFSRINNTINSIISTINLKRKKRQSYITLGIFLGLIVVSVVIMLLYNIFT